MGFGAKWRNFPFVICALVYIGALLQSAHCYIGASVQLLQLLQLLQWCNGVPVGALQRMDEAVWQQLLSPSAAKSSSSCAKYPTWLGGIACQRHRKTGSTQRCKKQELLRKS